MIPLFVLVAPLVVATLLFGTVVRRLRARSIAHLPGPPPGSWLVGNLPSLLRPKEAGDADLAWTREYGNARELLFTTDPKALQYILNTSVYQFSKPPEVRALFALTLGKGIFGAERMDHSRHRKIMNPAFSYGALRGFLPIFQATAQRTVIKLKEHVQKDGRSSAVVDIPSYIARTTLDAIGLAAFDYQFDAIDQGSNNKLSNAYNNLAVDAFLNRSDASIAFQSFWGKLPKWLITVAQHAPTKRLQRLRSYMKTAREVAQTLVDREKLSHATGKDGAKDVMSILIRANRSEDPKSRLENEEVLAQLTTLILAGHETTASTIIWALYELSRHLDFQRKVREEIKETRAQVAKRGDSELTVADLDSMQCLFALVKETLRYHPISNGVTRMADRDDVIPLAQPQKTKTGEIINSIPISKGQRVFLSFYGYNRLKHVWGQDAEMWRPERFLEGIEENQKTGLGVIANIATFSSGLRGCIGWRFAVIEMQAILIELVENLEFSPAPGNIEIIGAATLIMSPMIKDSNSRRTELPMTVKPISF